MKKLFIILLPILAAIISLTMPGCSGIAGGVAKYYYMHDYGNGEKVEAKVISPNEAGKVVIGVEAKPDGSKELKVDIDNLTKNDNTVEIVKSFEGAVTSVAGAFSPLLKADLPTQ